MKTLISFIITMITLALFDAVWFICAAKQMYADNLAMLLRKSGETLTPLGSAALMVYVFMALGIVYFVLPKVPGNYLAALAAGAVYGAVVFGVYEFTNYSILTAWPLKITLLDFIWGVVLCSSTSVVVTFIQKMIWAAK